MALWDKIASSGNVEDRRGMGGTAIGGVTGLIIFLLFAFLGGGSSESGSILEQVLGQVSQQSLTQQTGEQPAEFQGADQYETFTRKVLGSNNDVWTGIFSAQGQTYTSPKLVLFRGVTSSVCGGASSAMGPHYCPNDATIYMDETFFDELQKRFGGGSGDVAQAYVIAHEVGHHVQNQMGTMEQVMQARQSDPSSANELSVKLELQADCYAGIWASSLSQMGVFEQGEIKEALDAAAAVGDDRVQQKTQGQVTPENWTHGSSEQRVQWFTTGYESGKVASCNTFG